MTIRSSVRFALALLPAVLASACSSSIREVNPFPQIAEEIDEAALPEDWQLRQEIRHGTGEPVLLGDRARLTRIYTSADSTSTICPKLAGILSSRNASNIDAEPQDVSSSARCGATGLVEDWLYMRIAVYDPAGWQTRAGTSRELRISPDPDVDSFVEISGSYISPESPGVSG